MHASYSAGRSSAHASPLHACAPCPQERFDIEMAELDAEEAKLVEAEEEELWALTLQQQSRHIQVRARAPA